MPASALTPDAAVERLGDTTELRAAILLDERGEVLARAGAGSGPAERLAGRARELLRVADLATARAGMAALGGLQVSRAEGAVFCVRGRADDDRDRTLLAIAVPGALPALVLYDMRMALRAMGART